MTAQKPATALPYRTGPASTLEANKLGIRGIWTADKKTGVADVYGHRENAAYIVHAANAYPKLVEALRNVEELLADLERGGAENPEFEQVRALLRELGEAE